jgi:beta-N-acetylhexosaminidase
MEAAARRRRFALAAIAAVALVAGVVVGAGDDDESAPARDARAPITCPRAVAADPRRLVGQMLMVRMEATATDELRARVRSGELGGVILFPPEGADPRAVGEQVAALRRVADRAGTPAPLVAIDQEGGEVKRLPSLPPTRSPRGVARSGEAVAAAEGTATASALRGLGIDVDLAPVLDVPEVPGAFIASRTYSADAAQAGALGVAFGTSLQSGRVGATAKHFPGLGMATQNSDLGPSTIGASRAQLDRGLAPFTDAIAAGFDLVMVANATYTALDPRRPASQSPRVVDGLLRGDLGYGGVVITDDLGAGALTGAGLDEGDAAVGAARAGADLLLFALSDGSAARRALRAALADGELDRGALLASCARLTALRDRLAVSPSGAP